MISLLQRVGHWFYRKRIPLVPFLVDALIRVLFRCVVFSQTEIGRGTVFGYGGIAVVVHKRAVIGRNCMIGPRVTIGGTSGHFDVPVIGDNCILHTGAVVIGPIRLGCNVVVGANAVVNKSVPDHCVVAGVPAKIIKRNIDPEHGHG
jgi:serine O-acetyltransferase